MKRSKRYIEKSKLIENNKLYSLEDAVELVLKTANCKFDETIEIACKLGIDPKRSDQQVRGQLLLPHGSGKKVRVAVFAAGDKAKEAENEGAEIIGGADLAEKIQKGFLDFDVCISTPDMMAQVSKLGKILGPRGLMPNPKSGTVTQDIGRTVRDLKRGRIEFKIDKQGIIHSIVGKASFGKEKLLENLQTLLSSLIKAKPASAKGQFLRSVVISSSMGPGIKLDVSKIMLLLGK